MLIGPDAPIHLTGVRASHMEDAYDFYKPNLDSEYPVVFGHDSNTCYMRALDGCYRRYAQKFERQFGDAFTLASVDNVILHSPYNKLVKKSGARMLYNDFVRYPELPIFQSEEYAGALNNIRNLQQEQTYSNQELEKTFAALARPMYGTKVEMGCVLPSELGNSYTANCYTGLLSLIDGFANCLQHTVGKRILMFSYGSGLAATMFNLEIRGDISHIARVCDLKNRLRKRTFHTPEEFTANLLEREKRYNKKGYENSEPAPGSMWEGTFYLAKNDEFGRRSYKRVGGSVTVHSHGVATATHSKL
jgi:hydroxymethylglutaryl-CoA synthase